MSTFFVDGRPDGGGFADGNSGALKYDIIKRAGSRQVPDCIDLTECPHLKPYSVACLCSLAAVARLGGRKVGLKLPKEPAAAEHLCRLGVPDWFECGPLPEVVRRESNLPVEQVRWPPANAADRIMEMLVPSAQLPPGVGPRMKESLDEVLRNALTHAESDIDCVVVGQSFPTTGKVELAVLDLGQSIHGHLTKNPKYAGIRGDAEAIIRATEDAVTGTVGFLNRRGEPNSGAGLYELRKYCESGGGELTILSGDSWVTFGNDRPVIGRLYHQRFLGCLVNVRFYTGAILRTEESEAIL